MQVGRGSQHGAVSVAQMLRGLPELTSLDISGNFFGYEGCTALAQSLGQHSNVRHLDLSHNAGGFVNPTLAKIKRKGKVPSTRLVSKNIEIRFK
jgi:Ran GTPase-activating protein (RanGAP) involved in mRNA processing and transport